MRKRTISPNQLQLFDPETFKPVEIWREIPGYGGRYEASSEGRIRRVPGFAKRGDWREPILRPYVGSNGYLRVSLIKDDKLCRSGLHQVVALTFLGPCPAGHEIDHRDRDKSNNRVDNLEYVTHAENMRRGRETGWNTPHGVEHVNSKLTVNQVREIRASTLPQRKLGEIYGVSGVAIHYIRTGKTYQDTGRDD